jgi:hypothetical protein
VNFLRTWRDGVGAVGALRLNLPLFPIVVALLGAVLISPTGRALLSRNHSLDGDRPHSAVVKQIKPPNDRYALEDSRARIPRGAFRRSQPARGQTDRHEPTAAVPKDVSRGASSQPIYGWKNHEGAIEE